MFLCLGVLSGSVSPEAAFLTYTYSTLMPFGFTGDYITGIVCYGYPDYD